jgi:GTP-binding protein
LYTILEKTNILKTIKMALNIKKSDFVKSATKPSHYPDDIYSEFFFAGKSNAGKSSMLNKICNRKKLAITSKTPGRTQLINFFLINNNISFVDIPGYGFANSPKNIKRSWETMVMSYLECRKNIASMFIAVDIRRGLGRLDEAMLELCEGFNIKANIMLTKSDKVSNSEKFKVKEKTKNYLEDYENILNIQTFSAKNGDGVR